MNRIRNKIPKDYRPLVAAAEASGWVLKQGRGGHPKLVAPDGYATPVPTSSKNSGLLATIRKRLIERGVRLPDA